MKVLIFICLLQESSVFSLEIDRDKSCSRGQSCVVKDECPAIQRLYRIKDARQSTDREKESALTQLKNLICNKRGRGFCCRNKSKKNNDPVDTITSLSPQEYTCGQVDPGADNIFGGTQTFPGEFPFTALIGARKVIMINTRNVSQKSLFSGKNDQMVLQWSFNKFQVRLDGCSLSGEIIGCSHECRHLQFSLRSRSLRLRWRW